MCKGVFIGKEQKMEPREGGLINFNSIYIVNEVKMQKIDILHSWGSSRAKLLEICKDNKVQILKYGRFGQVLFAQLQHKVCLCRV